MWDENTPGVVCLGFFDGVHRGHLALLRAARETADQKGWRVCVHTFDRAPGDKGFELTALEEREALLRSAGADQIAVSAFDDRLRRMSGEEFFQKIVVEKLKAGHVVCGDDHRFGYRGGWGVKELRKMCADAGIGLTVVPPVLLKDGSRISSTAIRRALREEKWDLAEEMLGRPVSPEMKIRVKEAQIPRLPHA